MTFRVMDHLWPKKKKTGNKYGAKKTEMHGEIIDSKGEALRYNDLILRQKAGEISNLERQPIFVIIINGKHICKVILDFKYFDLKKKVWIYEDYKGFDTDISKLKRKMVEAAHNIMVTVITKPKKKKEKSYGVGRQGTGSFKRKRGRNRLGFNFSVEGVGDYSGDGKPYGGKGG